jgi:hypothetical protein
MSSLFHLQHGKGNGQHFPNFLARAWRNTELLPKVIGQIRLVAFFPGSSWIEDRNKIWGRN